MEDASLLVKHYIQHFKNMNKEEIIIKNEKIEESIFESPFLNAEKVFNDILPTINSNRFYAMSQIGVQGAGKTYTVNQFATFAEDAGFLVMYAKAEDIMPDLSWWVAEVHKRLEIAKTDKLFLCLDDFSYTNDTVSSKSSAKFKHFISDVKNIFKCKMFMIYNSHRLHALPPILRNSGTWMFSSMSAEDRNDAVKLIPRRKDQREKLDALYIFISGLAIDGPKYKEGLEFEFGKHKMNFIWGDESNPGDGRLFVSLHAAELQLFQSKEIPNMIDIDTPAYRIIYVPPIIDPVEEKAKKEKKKQKIREKANELFPIQEDEEF